MAVGESTDIAAELLARQHQLSEPYLLRLHGFTEKDFDRMAPENAYCELLDGVLILPSPVDIRHQQIIRFLLSLLDAFRWERMEGTEVLFGPAVMHLAAGRMFEPDVMVVLPEHAERARGSKVEGPADFVVEVLSPSTRQYDLTEKAEAYREGRVPEVWFVDDRDRRVLVDRPRAKRREHTSGKLASSVLRGFWIDVDWLWQSPLPNPRRCLEMILGET